MGFYPRFSQFLWIYILSRKSRGSFPQLCTKCVGRTFVNCRIRHRMIFFFYRIFVDISYGVLACAYMIFCILYSYFTEELREKQGFIVYLGFPLQSVAAIRTIIAVAISIERVLVRNCVQIATFANNCKEYIFRLFALLYFFIIIVIDFLVL